MVGVETGDSPQSLMLERYSTNYDALIAPIASQLALITILMKTGPGLLEIIHKSVLLPTIKLGP